MPKSLNPKNLQAEIITLTNELKSLADEKSTCALVRFCSLNQKTADKLLQQTGTYLWQIFPLTKDRYPNIAAWQKQPEQLYFEKNHDPLTRLPNKQFFEKTLAYEIERNIKHRSSLVLCILDIDNFKKINDTYGKPCGDTVLQKLAEILKTQIQDIDFSARIDGDEFALILPATNLLQAQKILEKLQNTIQNTVICSGQNQIHFSCSFGLTIFRSTETTNIRQLIKLADKAMYAAKKAGKNKIEILLPQVELQLSGMVLQSEKQFLFTGLQEK